MRKLKALLQFGLPVLFLTGAALAAGTDSKWSCEMSVSSPSPPIPWIYDKANVFLVAWMVLLAMECVCLRIERLQQRVLQLIALTLIVGVAYLSALTVANSQNGPAVFGLLGTIAGYLLGKQQRPKPHHRDNDQSGGGGTNHTAGQSP